VTVEVELARRDEAGNLIPWTVMADGSERTYDAEAHVGLEAVAAALSGVLQVIGEVSLSAGQVEALRSPDVQQVEGVVDTGLAQPLQDGGTVAVGNLPEVQQVAGEVRDEFRGGEVLGEQAGPGVLTFVFAGVVQLVWVRGHGGDVRCDPFGGVPSSTAGIPCEDGVPQPVTLTTDTVRVWATEGAAVAVWGYRYEASP
jgi:hypothetical protein